MEPIHAGEAAEAEKPVVAEPCAVGLELVRRHQDEIWWYLRFLGCQDAQADDLAQETFLAVLRKPPADLVPAAIRAYLRQVARTKYLATFRRRRREMEFDLELAEQIWADSQAEDTGEAWLDALGDCLAQVEGRARTAIDMTYRDGRSRSDIAAALDMTTSGVKTLLRRTREVLRQCVERKMKT